MSSMMRIVLVDPHGDVLFSGESLIARGPEALPETLPETLPAPATSSLHSSEAEDLGMDEPCPETMRSAGSGVYRAVDRTDRTSESRLRSVG
jgi:hypothetical protein